MAKRRMIHVNISISEDVDAMSLEARLLFTWMIPHTDDVGLLPGSPKKIKGLVVPLWEEGTEKVRECLKEMEENGLVKKIQHGEKEYYWLVSFSDYQTLRKDRDPVSLIKNLKDWEWADKLRESWKSGIQTEDNGNPSKEKRSKNKLREDKNGLAKKNQSTFPLEDYNEIIDYYQELKGIELKGEEDLPLKQAIKRMFKNDRTVEQIKKACEVCNKKYDDWTMETVRRKIPDTEAGFLSGNEQSIEIREVRDKVGRDNSPNGTDNKIKNNPSN